MTLGILFESFRTCQRGQAESPSLQTEDNVDWKIVVDWKTVAEQFEKVLRGAETARTRRSPKI